MLNDTNLKNEQIEMHFEESGTTWKYSCIINWLCMQMGKNKDDLKDTKCFFHVHVYILQYYDFIWVQLLFCLE